MHCWRTICSSLLTVILIQGSFSFVHAQTVVRDLNQPQRQRTAIIGLLGEFVQCAAYEVATPEQDLENLISQAHGFTPQSSGIIRVIRGGRISQDLLYSKETKFSLMHGDVLIALPSRNNLVNVSSQRNGTHKNRHQVSSELIQIAIINLLDRPVVFGVPAEMADLAGILHSLRQPLEKFPQIAQSIKVISPQRVRNHSNFKTNSLTSKFASGTVLVLNSHKTIDLSLVPHSLPAPRRLQTKLATVPEPQLKSITPSKEQPNRSQQKVIHPENIPQPGEKNSPQDEKDQLQLNGPLLQQTAASLPLVPQTKNSQPEEKVTKSEVERKSTAQTLATTSTVPDMLLKAAPAPPENSIQVLDDAALSSIDEMENANAPFLPQWSYYLFLAVIAAVAWKHLSNRSKKDQTSEKNHLKSRSASKDHSTIITNWNALPPMPKKSLLEQILENKIPVIEETPQIPTENYIYGRHQSKTARVDQPETLRGPHYNTVRKHDARVPQTEETTKSAPLPSTPKKTDLKLKAPAFRFDRSHPESSKSSEENVALPKASRPTPSKQKQTVQNEASFNSGILDRVLQAVQGVITK